MLQTSITMVAMMEPVAEQNPNEISWTNTGQVQWEKIMSPIGPTTQLNIVSKPRIAVAGERRGLQLRALRRRHLH